MHIEFSGILGFLVLVADIWAIVSVIGSNSTTGKKVLWVLLVLLLPVLGVILWYFLGPRAPKT